MPSQMRAFAAIAASLTLCAGALLAHDPHDPIQVIAISPNFSQDHTVLAATGGLTLKLGVMVLFKSTDGGVNWTIASGLLSNNTIDVIAFSPAYSQDQTVYLAGAGGLFVSTDGANTWTALSTTALSSMALSPNFATDNTLFVVTKQKKVLKSKNRGTTLTPLGAPAPLTSALTVIAVSPNFTADHTVLVGSVADGIFKTSNGGGSWTPMTGGIVLPDVTSLTFSPGFSSDKTAFAGTKGKGFVVSTNGGSTWTQSNTGLTDNNVNSIALSPTYAQDSTLWVATNAKGVFQSTNQGTSWAPPVTVPRQLSNLTTVHYQTLAAASGIQFLGMFEGLWTSANGGASWQYIDTCPTRFVRYVHMSPGYPSDQTVFLSTYGSGNLWTTDGGATWTLQNTGMQAPYTDGSAISPNFVSDGIAFSSNHNGLQRTSNRGATWVMMPGPGTTSYPRGLAVSPNFVNDQTVYIGTTSATGHNSVSLDSPAAKIPAGVYISTNAGMTWTLSGFSKDGVPSIAFSPAFATDQTAFAAGQTTALYRTTDNAATWTALTLPGNPKGIAVVAVSPNFAVDGVVVAAGIHGGIYKTADGGSTWSLLANTGNIRGLDIKFSPNYANDQTLFVGTVQFGLMESIDGGTTLSQVTSFPDVMVSALDISSGFQTDQTLFAAGYHGLYKSTNAGSTWTYLVTPARIEESRNVTSVLQEPPTIAYQGSGWSMVTPSSVASSNEYAATPEALDTVTFEFLGTGIRWLSWTGPLQGTASLQLDGVPLGTASLTALSDLYQQNVWEQHGIPCGNHTFTVTATPQVTQSISLDAFDIWLDSCPFASYTNTATLGASSASVGATAGSGAVKLTTDGPWVAYSNAPWLSLAAGSSSGTGSAGIHFDFTANTTPQALTGTLTIAGLTFTVTQAAAAPVHVAP